MLLLIQAKVQRRLPALAEIQELRMLAETLAARGRGPGRANTQGHGQKPQQQGS